MTIPMRLSADEIARVRAEHPIVQVLGQAGIHPPAMSGRGAGFMISCPLPSHEDSTPSCVIHPASERFYCFGCGAHGDVFTLVREVTGIRSLAQIAELLDRGGPISGARASVVYLPPRPPSAGPVTDRTPPDRVLAVNEEAWRFVTSDRLADQARSYLARRGLDTWRLETVAGEPLAGYTPADRSGLINHLTACGFSHEEILDAGWGLPRDGGLIDRFHRRVLLPIRNDASRVAGVIGRDVTDHAEQKYLNTARTATFHKGPLLYRPPIPASDEAVVIVCEGPMDALAIAAAATQVGAGGQLLPVAPCGTALTREQAQRILALSDRDPVVCADADQAGIDAARKWVQTLRAEGGQPRTVALPDGHDPASWLQGRGPAGVELLLGYATQQRTVTPHPVRPTPAAPDAAPSIPL